MISRRFSVILLSFAFPAQSALAGINVIVGDRSDISVVESRLTPVAIEKRRAMIRRLERKLLSESRTKSELEARFGAPSKWKMDGLVRPVGADFLVSPQNVEPADVEGLFERCETFPIAGVGRMLVFFGPDEKCYVPPVLFFNAADSMPALTDGTECQKRIDWESTRFDEVFKAAGTSAAELTPTDDEAKELMERSRRLLDQLDKI